MLPPSRVLLSAVALAIGLSACAPTPGETPTTSASDAARVNAAMATVADARAVVQDGVADALAAATLVQPIAVGLRSPSTIDEVLQGVPAAVGAFEAAAPSAVMADIEALDLAVGRGAGIVDQAIEHEPEGSWEREFLRSQRGVLDALAGWSVTNTSVIEVLDERWETWGAVLDEAANLAENRWRYRTPEEAAGTWEVEVGDRVRAATTASEALPAIVDGLAIAAERVRTADAESDAVFRARPTS